MPLLDEDYLILSTIHSAKGQEWKSVYLLNAVDGCMPSDLGAGTSAEIEEERRLLYVAMTRAKDDLASDRSAALLRPRPARARATATSMHPGRASSPRNCSDCSSARPGRLRRPVPRRAPPARDQSWISAPACAECGGRSSAQATLPSAFQRGGNRNLGIFSALLASWRPAMTKDFIAICAATLVVGVGVWGLRGKTHGTSPRRPKPCASSPMIPH